MPFPRLSVSNISVYLTPEIGSKMAVAKISTVDKTRWTCLKCTITNLDSNLNCTSCLSARPGEKLDLRAEQEMYVPTQGQVKQSPVDRFFSLFAKHPLDWKCPACQCKNGGYYMRCTVCGFERLKADVEKPKADVDEESSLISLRRKTAEEIHSPKDDSQLPLWECHNCPFAENPGTLTECKVCGVSRSLASEASLHDDSFEHLKDTDVSEQGHLGFKLVEADGHLSAHSNTDSGIYSTITTPRQVSSPTADLCSEDGLDRGHITVDVPSEETNGRSGRKAQGVYEGIRKHGKKVSCKLVSSTDVIVDGQHITR